MHSMEEDDPGDERGARIMNDMEIMYGDVCPVIVAGDVVTDMIDDLGHWRWNLFERFLPYEILLRIAAFKLIAYI
ncbi:hypothetical protein V6N12_061019 [Hibiscus sabdariffa]|uniref:Uncharacterized protein n=1 Tax=Hibiscus sabdariffa TaxID=183260 RepID=A0ABR2DVU2_9ROSI